ncbi:MAG: hypothetical protein M1140_01145 [Chloroflexi bacterium]|nr:hypothetical protein [Chloroflexota bacterium]
MVQHLAATGTLPIQQQGQNDEAAPWRQEGSQPPLYYAIAAIVTFPFDSSNWRDLRLLNPHSDLGKPTRDGNSNAVVHGAGEQFPWTRAALAIHVARLVSAFMSALTILFAYLVACELFPPANRAGTHRNDLAPRSNAQEIPKDPRAWLRLGTAVFTACVPMFAFISGSVNNDNAAAPFATMGLWWSLRLMRRADLSLRTSLVSGVITAAAALSKTSTLGLIGVFGLAAVFTAWRMISGPEKVSLRFAVTRLLRFIGVLALTTVILAGWWFVRNQQLYGDLFGWNAFLDVVGRRSQPATPAQLWSEREGFVWAYWGVFGTLNVIMPPAVYSLLDGMVVLSALGWIGPFVVGRVRKAIRPAQPATTVERTNHEATSLVTRYAAPILCLVWVIVTFAAFLRWTSLTPASQGRLLFPCIAVISAALVYGLYRIHRSVLWIASAGLAVLAFTMPFAVIAPAYAQPVAITQPNPASVMSVSFSGGLDLLGYDTPTPVVAPGGEATLRLYWRAHQALPRDYSIFVHLLNEDSVVIGQRDMYPGQGSLATSQLRPGYTWSDIYVVPVSALTLAPQKLHWAIGVYDLQTGERLSVTQGTATVQGVEFGQVELRPPAVAPDMLLDYGNGISLARYDVEPRSPAPGQPLTVTLVWRAASKVSDNYVVSLQLLDDKTNKFAQNDSAPVDGNAPTTSWQPGAIITDVHVLQVSKTTTPGVYKLQLVIYRPADFSRLGAFGGNGIYIDNQISLMYLRVK